MCKEREISHEHHVGKDKKEYSLEGDQGTFAKTH